MPNNTALTTLDPIAAPSLRKPGALPSLPEWNVRLLNAVRPEVQLTLDGTTFEKQEVLVLPKALMPNEEQRKAIQQHADILRSCLSQTPQQHIDFETRTATAVAKLLLVLSGERKSELAEQARSEVYLDVLEDVPYWAVDEAVRRWFRHECGLDELDRPYDYKWAPDPGALRRIARDVFFEFKARITQMQLILNAREYVDCSKELKRGRQAHQGLKIAMGLGTAADITFEEAIELGSQVES